MLFGGGGGGARMGVNWKQFWEKKTLGGERGNSERPGHTTGFEAVSIANSHHESHWQIQFPSPTSDENQTKRINEKSI